MWFKVIAAEVVGIYLWVEVSEEPLGTRDLSITFAACSTFIVIYGIDLSIITALPYEIYNHFLFYNIYQSS